MPDLPAWLVAVLRTLTIICLPVALVLTNVRLIMSNAYLQYEYGKPDFPPDVYGFTQADRLRYAPIALAYLLNDAGIEFLGDLTLPDGTPQYNARELRHMVDVKVVTRGALAVWIITWAIILASVVLLGWRPETRPALRAGLVGGSALAVGILLALVAYILINFNTFFVQFHNVFFESGTWMFEWSDTLIRLFPLRFWSDAFTIIGVATLVEGIIVGVAAWLALRGA
jgi:integral membrane protein (TIGR01906 family)